ncbi:MAG: hypothetical protein RSD19_05375, partial [Oscillospiraceae bacterium]
LPITIFGSRLLVIGFGKTAKRLCFLLAAMGAQITVSARRTEDTAYAESLGYNAQKTARLGEKKLRYDAIVNTVPALLFTPDVIDAVEPGTHSRPRLKAGRRGRRICKIKRDELHMGTFAAGQGCAENSGTNNQGDD